jgi:hypothetical protein
MIRALNDSTRQDLFSADPVTGDLTGQSRSAVRSRPVVGSLRRRRTSRLAQTLILNDLFDEYRLFTFPVVVGTGKRLFGAGAMPASLEFVSSCAARAGVAINVYRRAGALKTGSFVLPADDGGSI